MIQQFNRPETRILNIDPSKHRAHTFSLTLEYQNLIARLQQHENPKR